MALNPNKLLDSVEMRVSASLSVFAPTLLNITTQSLTIKCHGNNLELWLMNFLSL